MSAGNYKNGVAIIVTYQAVGVATGKTVAMDVYDESHALDISKSVTGMVEIAATGRYYATFTPDAEGEWIVIMRNTTDANGEVVKAYAVAGYDMDSVGDAIVALDDVVDAGFLAGAKEGSLSALATSSEIADLDNVIDAGFLAISSPAMVG